MTTITQTLHHDQQQVSYRQVTLEEACAAETRVNGYRYTYEASAETPDLLLRNGRAHAGERSIAVSVFDAETLERVTWEDLTATAEPVTVSGWYRSRVAGWVRVEWTNGRMRARAWASDQTAADRFVGITPTMRAILDAENDKDARR